MIKYLTKEHDSTRSSRPFDNIAGYALIKQELEKHLKLQERRSAVSGIAITGSKQLGKYYMASVFAEATGRSIHCFEGRDFSKSTLHEVADILSRMGVNDRGLLLFRDIDKAASLWAEQLNDCIHEAGKDIYIVATGENDNVAPLIENGLIYFKIPVDAPTLDDTKAFLVRLLDEKYQRHLFDVNIEDIAAITYQYKYGELDRLLHNCVLEAGLSYKGRVSLDCLIQVAMRKVFDRFSITEDFKEDELKTACIHEAGHVLTGMLMGVPIGYAAVCKLGKSERMGYTLVLQNMDELKQTVQGMMMSLGGLAAEEICNGQITIGGKSDLQNVLESLKEAIFEHGTYGIQHVEILSNSDIATELQSMREKKVQEELVKLYEKTKQLLSQHEKKVLQIAEILIEKGYVIGRSIMG